MLEVYSNTSQTVEANSAVTFATTSISDGLNRIQLINNNTIQFNEIGKYKTQAIFNLYNSTDTATTVTLQLYANGTAVNGTSYTVTVPATGYTQVIVNKIIKVLPASYGTKASIQFITSTGATVIGAICDVFKQS